MYRYLYNDLRLNNLKRSKISLTLAVGVVNGKGNRKPWGGIQCKLLIGAEVETGPDSF